MQNQFQWGYDMRQFLAALLLGLALCGELSRASDGAEHDNKIRDFVDKMSLEELIGQTLMVGFRADSRLGKAKSVRDSNEGLHDLVYKYKLGAVILFKHNFDEGKDDKNTWKQIHSLTSDLQKEAFNSGSKGRRAPLLIAIDQEGGARVRIEKSVTRVPDPMHIGATRSEERAREAGLVIGSEMRMLGINTVLAPVADINNNDLKDVIGKRAFGAHKDVVARLAVEFMLGLKTAGVLSFAKHFPGHGDAEEDPHLYLPKVNYADDARLRDWDMYPFDALVKGGVNGMVTAHLLGPLDPTNPVTISYKTIQSELRKRLAFQGIILTDDLADMVGILKDADNRITRERKEAAIAALEAGHDMLMFAFVRPEDDERRPERTLTADEFHTIYQALLSHYSEPGKREELEEKVVRIIKQKASLVPFEKFQDLDSWVEPLSLKKMAALREKNAVTAQNIFRESVVLISERGRFINNMNDSRLYGNGEGPLSRNRILSDPSSELLVVTPVVMVDDLTPAIIAHNHRWLDPSKVKVAPLVYGWSCSRIEEAREHWRKQTGEAVSVDCYVRTLDDGSKKYDDGNIARKAAELYEKAKDKPLVIFGIVTPEQVKILQGYLAKSSAIQRQDVIALVYTEPYLLPLEIYERRNVTVIELSEWPSARLTADALFGYNVIPKDVSYMPFSLRPRITRDTAIGHGIITRAAAPAEPSTRLTHGGGATLEPQPKPGHEKPPTKPSSKPNLADALLGTLFGVCGGLTFFVLPRRRLRWAAELGSQYNLKDFGWSLTLGGGGGVALYLLAPALQSIKWDPFNLGAISDPAVLYAVIFLVGLAAPAAWLQFISGVPKK